MSVSPVDAHYFSVGEKIQAKWAGNGRYYRCVILELRDNREYLVQFVSDKREAVVAQKDTKTIPQSNSSLKKRALENAQAGKSFAELSNLTAS